MKLLSHNYESPVGELLLVASNVGLRALLWPNDTLIPAKGKKVRVRLEGLEPGVNDVIAKTCDQLDEYFAGTRRDFSVPLDPSGTDFQRQVWDSLSKIPYGQTSSYGEQATGLGRPTAVRAVASANGKNPISIVVPCHRVIGANGKLTGFAGGLGSKKWLLQHEAAQLASDGSA